MAWTIFGTLLKCCEFRRRFGWVGVVTISAAIALAASSFGQVVINEVVYDSSPNATRFAEYVELYNAGDSAVDIGNWTLGSILLGDPPTAFFTDTIPGGSSIAPGDFFVLGNALNVPNVDYDLGDGVDLWPNQNSGGDPAAILELRDSSATLVDAFAYERNKGSAGITAEQTAQVAGGWWGNNQNYNNPDYLISVGRFLDGRDTNNNGRDFGVIPSTPGATNGLAQNANYSIPDVDALTPFDPAPGFSASFVRARVIDPTVADASVNETAIPASPQGGNAIIAWDDSGGGNMAFSTELVTKFDMYAFINTDFYGTPGTSEVPGAESTTYGIGSTGTLHNLPDPTGLFFGDVPTANGNTGIGWVIQKEDSASLNRVMLVDFNDGGPSNPASGDWTVLESIEMSDKPSGWHRLAIDYDPTTGDFTAVFDDQTFDHSTDTDVLGTFYVGYRESLAGTPDILRPPTFDLFVASGCSVTGDYDCSGQVAQGDLDLVLLNWGKTVPPDPVPDGWIHEQPSGLIGQSALDGVLLNWGNTSGSGASLSAVPEPSSVLVALFGLAAFAFSDSRRKR